ncbi:MAG: precorrin-8X methylmutase [Xenococcaceae cyanobacterium MO_188.B29]|nr:precorrin-8X methylmutase [Xenococcaceae cyanobacterium MO_188.B29]
MDLHITDVQSLVMIDHQIGNYLLSPAEYEIARQVIYKTADFDYLSLLRFSENSLTQGAAALAAHISVIVDKPAVQVGIVSILQKTFCNPIYCCSTTVTRPQQRKTEAAWGLETMAKNHPQAIYVIGQEQTALTTLVELIERKSIQPALIVATPPTFVEQDIKQWLATSSIPNIYVEGKKGNSVVASTIINSLTELAWQEYALNLG